jgi:hypothetical protein
MQSWRKDLPTMCQHSSTDTLTLDRLIEAAFDRARLVTSSQKAAAELASRTVAQWLARTGRLDLFHLLSPSAVRPRIGLMARARQAQTA